MLFRFLVKLPQHKSFTYLPRFYDPVKEERQQRAAAAQAQKNGEAVERNYERVSAVFKRTQKADDKPMLIRLVIVIILVLMLAMYLPFA
jgi:hypothetical protein